ncbi:MAG: vWA domain-containing protein [Candidatus Neomarinimicrobiota bacterium]
MTFLSPSTLWLLTGITIPIAIHLLSLFKQGKIEFSTIIFIKELKTTSIRRMQIQKLILLFLRVLMICCLVIMMAEPVTEGFMPGWLSAEQESKLIIIIDNSASMSTYDGERSFLERSKSILMTLVPQYDSKTNLVIAQTCPPKVVFSGLVNNPKLRNSVRAIKQTASHDYIWQNINWLLKDKNINEPIKECMVFSDMMHAPDSSFLHGIKDKNDWRFYFIQPKEVIDNVGILNASPVNRIKALGQLVKLVTKVKNSGTVTKPNISLELVFNENRVGQVVSELLPQKEKEFLFQAYPAEVGMLEGKIVIPGDHYQYDNQWYLSMPIMDQITCKIIASNSQDISLLEMIFKSIDSENKFLTVESQVQPDLNRLFLDGVDVVIIHDPKNISSESIKDLNNFLKEGGGVIWFQGETRKNEYYSELSTTIGFPQIDTLIDAGQGLFTTNILSENSDVLKNMQVRDLLKELPDIFKYVKTRLGSNQLIHWELNNSDPLLIEFSKGSGTVFYFSTLLNLNWNDLPIRGMIVPLLYRLIILTGTDEINTLPVLIDESKWISIDESKLRNKWEVISPSGLKEMIVPEYDREGIIINHTDELGIYKVYSNGEKFNSFPTRLHFKEYIQNRIQQKDIEFTINEENIQWLIMEDNFADSFTEVRHGKSLWKFFLIAAIILFLLETIIGRPNSSSISKISND